MRSKRYTNVGSIMLGFLVLMVGINTMSASVAPLSESQAFVQDRHDEERDVAVLNVVIHRLCNQAELQHVERLRSGTCTLQQGTRFSELLNHLEQISTRCAKIMKSVTEVHARFILKMVRNRIAVHIRKSCMHISRNMKFNTDLCDCFNTLQERE